MKSSIKYVALATILTVSTGALAEISVITHPSNGDAISSKVASKLFLGKSKKFPGGAEAVPIDQSDKSPSREEFHTKVTKKKLSQLKAYWSRVVFTGKGQPPKVVSSDAEVIELISKNPSMIGYVNSSSVTDAVKVVLTAP